MIPYQSIAKLIMRLMCWQVFVHYSDKSRNLFCS